MATLNVVEDYGASGDGSTDDSQAIQDAINDTTAGDTVVIPETADFYRLHHTDGYSSVSINIENAADNVTITGESANSKLIVDRDVDTSKAVSPMGVDDMSNASWQSISIKKLVFDGGTTEFNNAESNAFAYRVNEMRTGYDVLMEDCIFQNSTRGCLTMGTSYGISRITCRRCTARNSGSQHGFDPVGTGEGSPSDPEMQFINCESTNHGGYAIDIHSGHTLVDGFFATGNGSGMKSGSTGGPPKYVALRNVNHRNSDGNGYTSTHDDTEWTLDIDNVLFVNHPVNGLAVRGQSNCNIEGPLMIDGCTDDGIVVESGSSLNAPSDGGNVISQNGESYGLRTQTNATTDIDTYYHYANGEGPVGGGGSTTINTQSNEERSDLNVPGQSDVGAFSGSSDGGGDTSQEEPIFEDWTPRWEATTSDWTVSSTSSNTEDSILELSAGSIGRHGLSCDLVGTATDVDILGLVRLPNNDDSYTSYCRLIGRGAGSAGSETGYFVEFRDAPSFEITKYVDGISTGLASAEVDFTPGNWFYVRFNISGNELKARYWNYGESEPTTWDLTATDSEITTAGWVGAGGFPTDTQQWDTFSVGTGGESAQFVGNDNPPSVAWKNPGDGTTVTDTVTLKIAASDPDESDDSLTTEYRIDGNSWLTTSYNSTSGYYEASWDSTTVANGDHSLEARVTDSAGNSSSSTISVTTDNGGDSPVVEGLSATEVETSDSDAEFDVDWQVSDPNGNLDSVDTALVRDADGSTADATTVSISGDTASETTRLVATGDDGSGNSYTVELAVTDGNDNTASATTSTTETEDTGEAPTIHRFSVSEAGRPDPHAEVTAMWDVSDVDGDLASVDIAVADSSSTIKSVSWTLSGSSASDTDSFKIKQGDGQTFDVSLTVTDATGKSASETVSVTA